MPTLDVVVLAAGRGSRLLDVGADRPKWLLEVRGKTIAARHVEALQLLGDRVGSVTVVTGHAADAIDPTLLPAGTRLLHNAAYLPRNNWYSVLLALRELGPEARVVVVNGDLCAPPEWLAAFFEWGTTTADDAALAVDYERQLTEESMKVSARADGSLALIGKHEFSEPLGEYVGMLLATGRGLASLRAELEAFDLDPAASQQWYEGAVGRSAASGARWTLWPTPDSVWVEIDDLDDLTRAEDLIDG